MVSVQSDWLDEDAAWTLKSFGSGVDLDHGGHTHSIQRAEAQQPPTNQHRHSISTFTDTPIGLQEVM